MIDEKNKKRYMLGIYDKIFKAILINKDNIEYLKYLIHYVTKIPLSALKNIKIENTLHQIQNKKDKEMESDILVSIDDKIINIEMDKDYYDGVFQKDSAYLHDYAARQFNEADDYKNGKQIIQIVFQNFDYFKAGIDIYEFKYIETTTGITLDKDTIKYFIPISFIKEKCYNNSRFIDGSKFEKYCLMLDEEKEEELEKIVGDDEVLKKVKENIEKLNEDKDLLIWYDAKKREEMEYKLRLEYDTKVAVEKELKIAVEKELKAAVEKELNNEKIRIAKKMLEKGSSKSDIAEITGLTI